LEKGVSLDNGILGEKLGPTTTPAIGTLGGKLETNTPTFETLGEKLESNIGETLDPPSNTRLQMEYPHRCAKQKSSQHQSPKVEIQTDLSRMRDLKSCEQL
jgi:hypothetical protein